jgi:Single-strand binding protein family
MSFLLSPLRAARTPLTTFAFTRAFSTTRPSHLARLTLVGRLGTDPEITTTNNGGEVIKYVVGTSYGPKDNRQTSWFRVASFAEKESLARGKVMGLTKG